MIASFLDICKIIFMEGIPPEDTPVEPGPTLGSEITPVTLSGEEDLGYLMENGHITDSGEVIVDATSLGGMINKALGGGGGAHPAHRHDGDKKRRKH